MRQRGFTLVELMVTLAIAIVLLGLGVTSFSTMISTTQSRNVAESILSGLRLARAEAIKRNIPMRFQLVDSLDDTCNYNAAAGLWVVTQSFVDTTGTRGLAAGHCASAAYTPPDQADICSPDVPPCSDVLTTNCRGATVAANPNPATCSDDPLIAFKSDGGVPVSKVNVLGASGAYAVTFNPLGRVIPNYEISTALNRIDITPIDTSAKSWRIRILPDSGSIKLCDPNGTTATSALACP